MFVEVRYRRENGLVKPELSLSPLKILRLKSAVACYIAKHSSCGTKDVRVDLCAVTGSPQGCYRFNLIKGVVEF